MGGAAASSIVLIVYNRLIFVSKRQKVYRLALAPLSLHTSSIDVPSPDVNLKGSALPADPQIQTYLKNVKMYFVKNMSFLKVSGQMVSIAVFGVFFYIG